MPAQFGGMLQEKRIIAIFGATKNGHRFNCHNYRIIYCPGNMPSGCTGRQDLPSRRVHNLAKSFIPSKIILRPEDMP
jgi:hypothetical protein